MQYNTPEKRRPGIFRFCVKMALTMIAAYAFVVVLQLVRIASVRAASRPQLDVPLPTLSLRQDRGGQDDEGGRFWPRFLGGHSSDIHEMQINGVRMITESWEARAASRDIISYYRAQMGARGWNDVTEETFHLAPEQELFQHGESDVENGRYAKRYADIVDSNLLLRRGSWSLYFTVEPGRTRRRTRIRVCAVETPSLREFSEELMTRALGLSRAGGEARPVEAVERSAGGTYRTSISRDDRDPDVSFGANLEGLRDEGWQLVMESRPSDEDATDHFAVIRNGDTMGYLIVDAAPDGDGSSVTLTRVEEE